MQTWGLDIFRDEKTDDEGSGVEDGNCATNDEFENRVVVFAVRHFTSAFGLSSYVFMVLVPAVDVTHEGQTPSFYPG